MYGFAADPSLPIKQNVCVQLAKMPTWHYFNRPTNLSFHDLTLEDTEKPPNLQSLLGLGLKFIPTPRTTAKWSKLEKMTVSRLNRDAQLKCYFAGDSSTFEGDKRMYVRSGWTPPPWLFPREVKYRLKKMNEFLKREFKSNRKKTENLLPFQHAALKQLQVSDTLLVVQCDKNLGPALIERSRYIHMVNHDHLLDRKTYLRLSEREAAAFAIETKAQVLRWIDRNRKETTKMERRFVKASVVDNATPLPKFYATMKVHKTPLKSRPIVSCSGTLLENLGVWVDRKLQHFLPLFSSYFKSSEDLKKELDQLDSLPPTALLFTSDAVSMYTSIPTETALAKITRFLRRHERIHNEKLPYNAIIEGLGIVMRRCAFTFGDTYWEQLSGTAMGTPPAPPYATIYFGLEEQKFLRHHRANLLFYRRFIDDVFGIWIKSQIRANPGVERSDSSAASETTNEEEDAKRWELFLDDLDSAPGLVWETETPKKSVVFMDLTLTIENGRIISSLYEKPSNRHLYIPPHSCHPPGMITGVVYGMVRRILTLCSDPIDQQKRLSRFVLYLRARGHHQETIVPMVNAAVAKTVSVLAKQRSATDTAADVTPQSPPREAPDPDPKQDEQRLFLHLPFHPDNPPSRCVQRAWKRHVSRPPFSRKFREIRNHKGVPLGFDRLTVAYHRSHNLGNLLSYRDLQKRNGPSVSSLID